MTPHFVDIRFCKLQWIADEEAFRKSMYSSGSLASSSQGTETLEDSVNFTANTISVYDRLIQANTYYRPF